ncbi:MAG: bifunctional oligoribonuclease/PAP phosphatase NrnA [Clostridia bacterium]|nr:bifunctional oligoribonuclease/PAP phosphatase NrnA [Clostridia bacterium]
MKSTKKITIEQTAQQIKQCNSIALFAHTNPDGDTLGSCIALSLGLKKLGKTVEIFCDQPITGKLATFELTKLVHSEFFGKYDLYVAVDCGDVFRVGEFSCLYDSQKETLTIDHHGGACFSKYNCLYQYASTCQIVYEILKCLDIEFDATIATYLYMGLCTDTGNFSNSSTDADSHKMASELIPLGADFQYINRTFFRDIELNELKLHARVLSRMRTYYDGQMVLLYVHQSDIDEFGLDNTVTTGLVHYANDVVTAKVAVCVSQDGENAYKVSMRGKNFNVREVCQYFGGGGHLLASGCRICGYFEDVIEQLVRVVGFTI